ncbi:MAG: protoporphyrinogen/coproporphyrinogen oxidase, partial [Myxococcota bacterium]
MRIAVVGAGISGLACALRLGQAGHAVRVYERAPTVGGRMATVEADGFHVDVGTSVLLDNYERTKALCRELGMETEWVPFSAGAGGILREGRLSGYAPETVADIARYPGLSPSARARVLRWLLRALPRRTANDFFDLTVGDDALDTVDAYTATVETCGQEVADWLVDPFVRAFHFHSARRVSMKYFDALATLFLTKEGFVHRGFRGYMQALPRALAARVPVERAEVRRVEPDGNGVRVDLGGRSERFDGVVLAVPAHVALGILAAPT